MAATNRFCSECGSLYEKLVWPRVCDSCKHEEWRNPKPVVILLVPIFPGGLLTVRRNDAEHFGQLALPGGYVEFEDYRTAAARELWEETGIDLREEPLSNMELYDVRSGTKNFSVLIFVKTRVIYSLQIERQPFIPNKECQERVIIHEPTPLAFPTHMEMVTRFFV